jgi:hypothetical protein
MLAVPGATAGFGAATGTCAISRPGCASVTKPRRHAANPPAILIPSIFIALSQPSLFALQPRRDHLAYATVQTFHIQPCQSYMQPRAQFNC